MRGTNRQSLCAVLCVVVAQGLWSGGAFAGAPSSGTLQLPGRSISVAAPKLSASHAPGLRKAVIGVRVGNGRAGPLVVERSDFKLSAGGDMLAVSRWDQGRSRVKLAPQRSASLRLTFAVPSGAVRHGALFYRPGDGGASGVVPLRGTRANAESAFFVAATQPTIKTFQITQGVGDPWGTEIDSAGNIWFAEAGCDFAPTCNAGTPPGQLVKLDPSTGAFSYYTLPNIPGNQPIFVAFDGVGHLWFTTPNNSMIGEFSPSTGTFVGQWPVTAGSGPWDLTFANGQIWYTEHLGSAVGRFNPTDKTHQDFPTPTANSNPYGIAASGAHVWFTENNSSVDKVAVLDTGQSNAITEYPIVKPLSGTPHLIVIAADGHPWWTEGWSNTIATLNPAAATPGNCGTGSGTCTGIRRFPVPAFTTCGASTHTSGIAYEAATDQLWLDNSLTAQVGSFSPSTGTFAMTTLDRCSAHPHDGVSVDLAGNVWFDEEFANAIGELVVPGGSPAPAPGGSPAPAPGGSPAPAPGGLSPPTPGGVGLAPANTAVPTIRGTPRQAHTLTALPGSWAHAPTNFSYRWQRCRRGCADIHVARSSSYRLTARDIDARIRVVVTATNSWGSANVNSVSRGPVGPSLARVRRSLSRLLADSTARRTVTELVQRGGARRLFGAPSRGVLKLVWRVGRVPIASGRRRVYKTGSAAAPIRMTSAGKRLLRGADPLAVVAKVVFIATRQRAIARRKRFTLSPGTA
jgi:virginiamycin B lyase